MRRSGRRAHGFRPDVEGLRAVAVLAVVLFHAAVPGFGGGFIGVDVFYVISGFLITGLLWRELSTSGRISLPSFYARRARRLLPAAMLVLVATAAVAVWQLPPLSARSVIHDAEAAAVYGANYRFAVEGSDYLAASAPPSPLQHYWSLGVEEQFYLLWPLLLLVAVAVGARRRAGVVAPPRRGRAIGALAVIAVGSFALSLDWTRTSPSWAFYSLPTRAWELAVGGLLALFVPALRRLPAVAAVVIGWVGLGAVVGGVFDIGRHTAFPGTAALVPVLGAAGIIVAGCRVAHRGPTALLGIRPLQAIGRGSYSWYLWHWPVLVLGPAVVGHPLGLAGRLVAVALSAAAAWLTLTLVENPVRYARPLREARPAWSLGLAGTLGVTALLVSLASAQALPNLRGPGPAAAPVALPSIAPAGHTPARHVPDPAHSAPPPMTLLQRTEAPVTAAVAHAVGTRTVPSNLHPPLSQAYINKAEPFFDGCALTWTAVTQGECAYADTASRTRIVLFGDSHAAQWEPTFEAIADARHWRVESLNKSTCPPLELPLFSPVLGREYTECEQWRQEILTRIRAEHPALVVLGVARHYDASYHFTVYSRQWLDGMAGMIRQIRAMGVPVLMMGAIPKPPADVPTCLSAHLTSVPSCTFTPQATVNAAGIRAEQAATKAAGGTYLNLIPLFCTANRCPVIVGDNLVYRDDNHLTTYYARWLAPVIAAQLTMMGIR